MLDSNNARNLNSLNRSASSAHCRQHLLQHQIVLGIKLAHLDVGMFFVVLIDQCLEGVALGVLEPVPDGDLGRAAPLRRSTSAA